MAVVTISRGSASGGLLLAQKLGEKLGYEIVSREDVIREAARFGASEETLQEALLKPPTFWDRFKHERRRYLAFVQSALCERARKDRIIYHGNAGHLLLCEVPHVLRIRLIASMPFRIRMVMERQHLSRKRRSGASRTRIGSAGTGRGSCTARTGSTRSCTTSSSTCRP